MPLVEINEEDVQAKLAIGPVGIGEDHSKTRAREFLCRIINLNIVKVLFLEIPGDQGKSFDTCLAKALSMRASGNGKGSIDFAQKELNPIDARLAQNPIKFSELIGLAWKHDVRVVFSDKFYSRPGQAASEAGMKTRNEFV